MTDQMRQVKNKSSGDPEHYKANTEIATNVYTGEAK